MPDVVRAGKDRQESSDGNQAGREREREGVILLVKRVSQERSTQQCPASCYYCWRLPLTAWSPTRCCSRRPPPAPVTRRTAVSASPAQTVRRDLPPPQGSSQTEQWLTASSAKISTCDTSKKSTSFSLISSSITIFLISALTCS